MSRQVKMSLIIYFYLLTCKNMKSCEWSSFSHSDLSNVILMKMNWDFSDFINSQEVMWMDNMIIICDES